jgi:hypothetical protein
MAKTAVKVHRDTYWETVAVVGDEGARQGMRTGAAKPAIYIQNENVWAWEPEEGISIATVVFVIFKNGWTHAFK